MPNNLYGHSEPGAAPEEYSRRRQTRAKKRQKRRTQRVILFAALAASGALVIFSLVLFIRAIFGPSKPAPSAIAGSGASQAGGASLPTPESGASAPVSTPTPGVNWPTPTDPNVWNLALVNGQHPLPDGHRIADENLGQVVNGGAAYFFDSRVVPDLTAMMDACNAATGGSLRVVSGYRGASTQDKNYNYLVTLYKGQGLGDTEADQKARMLDPPAGYSEHQTGLAVDFAVGDSAVTSDSFAQTAEYAWLVENAAEHGFILRYTADKETVTGMAFQPYHFRYVGADDARTVKNAGVCLEEYLVAVSGVQPQAPAGGSSVPGSAPAGT